jgi:hypothetical protein
MDEFAIFEPDIAASAEISASIILKSLIISDVIGLIALAFRVPVSLERVKSKVNRVDCSVLDIKFNI